MGVMHHLEQPSESRRLIPEYNFISFSVIKKQVEETVCMIERIVTRTHWLAPEDKKAISAWIQAQKDAAKDCIAFIDQRTKKVTEFIMSNNE
jgi:hypothetical protein